MSEREKYIYEKLLLFRRWDKSRSYTYILCIWLDNIIIPISRQHNSICSAVNDSEKNFKDIAVNFIAYLFPLSKRDHIERKMKHFNVIGINYKSICDVTKLISQ